MDRIIGENSTGKTRQLMILAKENNGVFLCKDPDHMRQKALAYGIIGLDIRPYFYDPADYEKHNKPVYIDDLDTYLHEVEKNIMGYNITLD